MKRSAAILLIAALLSAAGTCGAQESSEPGRLAIVAGGEASFAVDFSPALPFVPGGRSTFSPKLAATAPGLDLSVSARASVDSLEGASLALDEARIRFDFQGFAALEAGRFVYRQGTALFFSNVEYFSPPDFSRILREGLGATGSPNDLAQLKIIGDAWHIMGTFAPFNIVDVPLPTDSPWFPRRSIRDSFTVLSTTYLLRNLSWQEVPASAGPVPDPGFSVEAGGFLGPLDTSFSYYDGPDRSPAVTGFITLPVNPWGVYDVTLEPVRSRVRREGGTASLQLGPFKAWADASLFQGKLLASGDLYSAAGGWRTGTKPVDGIDFTTGFSWSPPIAGSLVSLEWKHAWYSADVSGLTFPLLHRALAALVSFSFFEEKLGLSFAGVCSLEDWSFAVMPGLTIDLGGDRSLVVAYPFFFGDPGTELGQFGAVQRGVASVSMRF